MLLDEDKTLFAVVIVVVGGNVKLWSIIIAINEICIRNREKEDERRIKKEI